MPLTPAPALLHTVLTARDGGARLRPQPALRPASCDAGPGKVLVDVESAFQIMFGFGGAFTEAAALTWLGLNDRGRQTLLTDYFDTERGHGYSLCRVHMGSCDFARGNYAHVERPGDTSLSSFSIERDRQSLIPFIQAAQRARRAPLKLLASPWSPPAWMKSNGRMNDGGTLLPEFRTAWAQCYVRFIQAYAAEGIPIWGVSVQNEPDAVQRWDSCVYSAIQERDFVRDYLGPQLHAAGLSNVRILIWDHNRDLMLDRATVIFSDPGAAQYVWGTGFHWYGEDYFEHVQAVHDAFPEKHLLFTEGCQEGGPHRDSWELGERYARSMIHDLNRWTEGCIDWNLLLDERGGPNHAGNYCSAPILATPDGNLAHQSSYFYIGHFSRYVRSGARRVACAVADPSLEASAFVNPDRSRAVVVLNRTESACRFSLEIDGRTYLPELPPRSIATYVLAPP